MNETDRKLARLAAPFPPKAIHWRVGRVKGNEGLALAYLDARDVMDRFDAVMGPANWQVKHTQLVKSGVTTGTEWVGSSGKREKKTVEVPVCEVVTVASIGLKLDGEWVWKSDAAGESSQEGVKGSASDAEKRAAVQWGVGRYLYRLDSPYVPVVKQGGSTVISPDAYEVLSDIIADAIWAGSPVYGENLTASGHEAMRREDLQVIEDLVVKKLDGLSSKDQELVKPVHLLAGALEGTAYEGWSFRDLAVAPRSFLQELGARIAEWQMSERERF